MAYVFLAQKNYDNFQYDDTFGVYTAAISSGGGTLSVGITYKVIWDGAEYDCVGQDMSFFMEGAVAVGDLSNFGALGNDEPFMIASLAGSFMLASFDTEESHEVGIVDVNNNIVPEKTFNFNPLSNYYYSGPFYGMFALYPELKCIVMWDGTEYKCTAKWLSDDIIGIGNASILGGETSDEPFYITMTLSEWENGFYTYEAQQTHSIAILLDDKITANIVIKNRDGEDIEYSDVEIIRVNTTDGEVRDFVLSGVVPEAGSSLPPGLYWNFPTCGVVNQYSQYWFEYNKELYAFAMHYSGGGNDFDVYKLVDNAWTQIISNCYVSGFVGPTTYKYFDIGNKKHMVGSNVKHLVFDGNELKELNDLPYKPDDVTAVFMHEGKIKFHYNKDRAVYAWDENADAWYQDTPPVAFSQTSYVYPVSVGNDAYFAYLGKVYKYKAGVGFEFFDDLPRYGTFAFSLGDFAYYTYGTLANTEQIPIYKYNVVEKKDSFAGCVNKSMSWYSPAQDKIYIGLYPKNTAKQEVSILYDITE